MRAPGHREHPLAKRHRAGACRHGSDETGGTETGPPHAKTRLFVTRGDSGARYPNGTVTVTRWPSPTLSRHRPGRAAWPTMDRVSRAPIRSPSPIETGAVSAPRRARFASTCHPVNPAQSPASGSPASTSPTVEPGPDAASTRLSSPDASQSRSSSASSMITTPGPSNEATAAASESASSSAEVNTAVTPSPEDSERSGDGRGAMNTARVPAARNDRAMDTRIVDLPDPPGPATTKAGTPADRSGPSGASASPPTPTSPQSADAATGPGPVGRSAHACSKVTRVGAASTRNGR